MTLYKRVGKDRVAMTAEEEAEFIAEQTVLTAEVNKRQADRASGKLYEDKVTNAWAGSDTINLTFKDLKALLMLLAVKLKEDETTLFDEYVAIRKTLEAG